MALRARSPEGDAHVVPCCDCAPRRQGHPLNLLVKNRI